MYCCIYNNQTVCRSVWSRLAYSTIFFPLIVGGKLTLKSAKSVVSIEGTTELAIRIPSPNFITTFLHELGGVTCSGIDALPSFPGASTISSSSRFVVEGVFRESDVIHSFKVVDPVLFVFGRERSQTRRDKLVLQEWGFCGRAGNPPKENQILISRDAQPRIP